MILTKLSKEDFEKILRNYNIGKYKSHKHLPQALENTVYFLKTTKGKFILKIFERSSLVFIKYEIKIREHLRKKRLPIPEIFKTKTYSGLFKYKNKNMTIEKFMRGKNTTKLNKKMVKNSAKIMAAMHKELLKLKLRDKSKWKKNHLFEPMGCKIEEKMEIKFKEEENKALNDIRKLKKAGLRRGIIHSDFQDVNLLFKDDKLVAIIDWDDAHEDYLCYDVAVFLAHSFIKKRKVEEKKIKLFFKTYQKKIRLNEEEKKAIYYFMKRRFLGSILWCYEEGENHKDRVKGLNKWARGCIKCYRTLEKFPLEDFLKLF